MNNTIRNIQLTAVLFVLISTIIAFLLEVKEMYDNKNIELADLLLMFIYIEVIGLVKSYWETRSVRITYPLVIAITALARFIILQDKDSDPSNLIYISIAILIVAIATVVIRFRNSKYLKIDNSKVKRALKHSKVFFNKQAIVIGPTPPGTGVIALTLSFTSSKLTSPTILSPTY